MSTIDNAILVYKVLDRASGMNMLSIRVLFMTYLIEEKLLMHEIAKEMEVTVAAISICAAKLEKLGFIKRKRQEQDRRQVQVILTAKGAAFVERLSQNA